MFTVWLGTITRSHGGGEIDVSYCTFTLRIVLSGAGGGRELRFTTRVIRFTAGQIVNGICFGSDKYRFDVT